MSKSPKSLYIHTIGGKPAFFDGQQLTYFSREIRHNKLAKSLLQIRKEQWLTKRFRSSAFGENGEYPGAPRLGYIRIRKDL